MHFMLYFYAIDQCSDCYALVASYYYIYFGNSFCLHSMFVCLNIDLT